MVVVKSDFQQQYYNLRIRVAILWALMQIYVVRLPVYVSSVCVWLAFHVWAPGGSFLVAVCLVTVHCCVLLTLAPHILLCWVCRSSVAFHNTSFTLSHIRSSVAASLCDWSRCSCLPDVAFHLSASESSIPRSVLGMAPPCALWKWDVLVSFCLIQERFVYLLYFFKSGQTSRS